ncbi:MAG TPA: hypothetical protein VJQ44_13235 [Gemmatimonadales bacterium]|nr:hypothetical protein [Gemmatimonadales bacterium]
MPVPADRTPFELVDEGHGRYGSYRGRDRRRIHPRVSVSDRLTEARRGAWTAVALRVVLVLVVWSLTAAPALHTTHPMAALLCPLGYLVLEGTGLALVLAHLTALARAGAK